LYKLNRLLGGGLFIATLSPTAAWAQAVPYGQVIQPYEMDEAGAWTPVTQATEAWVERAGQRGQPKQGFALTSTDRIITEQARLEISRDDGEVITIYEDTTVVLEEWGITHELGAMFVEVSDYFKISWGSSEAVVEGTAFKVESGGESFAVMVEEGAVRVKNPAGEVLATAGKVAEVLPGVPPSLRDMSDLELDALRAVGTALGILEAIAPDRPERERGDNGPDGPDGPDGPGDDGGSDDGGADAGDEKKDKGDKKKDREGESAGTITTGDEADGPFSGVAAAIGGGYGAQTDPTSEGGRVRLDLTSRFAINERFGVQASFGMLNGSETSQLPLSLGAVYRLGQYDLGLDLIGGFGYLESSDGGIESWTIRPGAALTGARWFPINDRGALLVDSQLGYASGLLATVSVGGGLRW